MFELQRRMGGIGLEQGEILIGENLDFRPATKARGPQRPVPGISHRPWSLCRDHLTPLKPQADRHWTFAFVAFVDGKAQAAERFGDAAGAAALAVVGNETVSFVPHAPADGGM